MDLPFVTAERLADLVTMETAIDALETAFGAPALPASPPRTHLDVGRGDLLLMPSWSDDSVGVKLVTVNPTNADAGRPLVNGLYVLFSQETLQPIAAFDAASLTAIRTAAVSGLATRYLARPDAETLVMFGAGTQARRHLEAMTAVRPLGIVVCVSRTARRLEEFLQLADRLGIEGRVGTPEDVEQADVVCTCTTSSTPVFAGMHLADGAHVNAVGAYKPTTRELDTDAIRRSLIVVETRAAALSEAGDILIPIGDGVIDERSIVADLSEVVRGAQIRRSPDDLTIFKSVGVAFEDLVVATAAYERLDGDPDLSPL